MKKVDYLIIGSGIAGLTTALKLKEHGSVLVMTKGRLKEANSYWAQGGIAAVLTQEDRFKKHIEDTQNVGLHHGDRDAIRHLVEGAPKAIRFLQDLGVKFQKEPALEGGHSQARVWRTSDFTGQDVLNVLIKQVHKAKTIEIMEQAEAVELITVRQTCRGVYARLNEAKELTPILARHTVLATGGLGQLYAKTSNPRGADGSGLAMAVNAGLELEDLEFVQFHPTALDIPDEGRYFLLSETLRGFGAKVINQAGESFLYDYDRRGELAPRDVVTRAIFFERMNSQVYLDMRHLDQKELKCQFPNITGRLKKYGFDLSRSPVPITPVAHFSNGGIPVDIHGATQLPGLYAVGEVACSRVHGANRLASNALLEGLVFGEQLAKTLERAKVLDPELKMDETDIPAPPAIAIEDLAQVKAYAKRVHDIMWEKVGIVRSPQGLREALKAIVEIPARDYRVQHRQIVCYKLIQAAIARPESLGCHYIASPMS